MRIPLPLILALALSSASCGRQAGGESGSRELGGPDIDALALGVTTPADIEQRFGRPGERQPDGALSYPFRDTRRRSGAPGHETVTFRFTNGTLARICRDRS